MSQASPPWREPGSREGTGEQRSHVPWPARSPEPGRAGPFPCLHSKPCLLISMIGPGALWVPSGRDWASGGPLGAGGSRRGPFPRHLLTPQPVLTGTLSERLCLTTANIHRGLPSSPAHRDTGAVQCSHGAGPGACKHTPLRPSKGPTQFCDMHDASFTARPWAAASRSVFTTGPGTQ